MKGIARLLRRNIFLTDFVEYYMRLQLALRGNPLRVIADPYAGSPVKRSGVW
jgi:hypothetical protein